MLSPHLIHYQFCMYHVYHLMFVWIVCIFHMYASLYVYTFICHVSDSLPSLSPSSHSATPPFLSLPRCPVIFVYEFVGFSVNVDKSFDPVEQNTFF